MSAPRTIIKTTCNQDLKLLDLYMDNNNKVLILAAIGSSKAILYTLASFRYFTSKKEIYCSIYEKIGELYKLLGFPEKMNASISCNGICLFNENLSFLFNCKQTIIGIIQDPSEDRLERSGKVYLKLLNEMNERKKQYEKEVGVLREKLSKLTAANRELTSKCNLLEKLYQERQISMRSKLFKEVELGLVKVQGR